MLVPVGTLYLMYCVGMSFHECLLVFAVGAVAFYFAHWEEVFAEELVLGPLTGPTELECGGCAMFLLTWVFGTDYVKATTFTLASFTFPLSRIVTLCIVSGSLYAAVSS
jgi:hypothetical protein